MGAFNAMIVGTESYGGRSAYVNATVWAQFSAMSLMPVGFETTGSAARSICFADPDQS